MRVQHTRCFVELPFREICLHFILIEVIIKLQFSSTFSVRELNHISVKQLVRVWH